MAEAERPEHFDDSVGMEADNSDSDDYDPSSNMPFSNPEPDSPPNHESFLPPTNLDSQPSATSTPIIQDPSRTASRASDHAAPPIASATVPRMKGGFLVEDDEDDEKGDTSSYEPTGVTDAMALSEERQLYVSQNSSDSILTTNVSIQKDGANVVAPDPAISSHSNVPAASSSENNGPSQSLPNIQVKASSHTVPGQAPTPVSSLPKARLPNDRVGMLEDRIKEDPRGDMEAWLDLIKEHQARNKLEEARRAYDRFFQVFPSAVSCLKSDTPVNYIYI